MKFLCRATEHELSRRVLEAFAEGTPGALLAPIGPHVWGDERIPVYYGILRGCGDAIKDDIRQGRPFVYIDHGYFGDKDNVNLTGHYRIVVGGLHHRIPEWPKPESSVAFPVEVSAVADLGRGKSEMIIVPPSVHVAEFYGIDPVEWARGLRTLFPNGIVSTKADGNLDALLTTARGVITHSSTAAVKALVMGLAAWCTAERAPVPNHANYDRIDLLAWLAERQFTLGEIRDGRHLQFLGRQIEEFRAEGVPGPGVGGGASHIENRAYPM